MYQDKIAEIRQLPQQAPPPQSTEAIDDFKNKFFAAVSKHDEEGLKTLFKNNPFEFRCCAQEIFDNSRREKPPKDAEKLADEKTLLLLQKIQGTLEANDILKEILEFIALDQSYLGQQSISACFEKIKKLPKETKNYAEIQKLIENMNHPAPLAFRQQNNKIGTFGKIITKFIPSPIKSNPKRKNCLNEIINSAAKTFPLLYGRDYKAINTLASEVGGIDFCKKEDCVSLPKGAQSWFETYDYQGADLEFRTDAYKKDVYNDLTRDLTKEDKKNNITLCQALLKKHQAFLPKQYEDLTEKNSNYKRPPAKLDFPSSATNQCKAFWAHHLGNLILSMGPKKGNLPNFLQLILEEKPAQIVALGKFGGVDFCKYADNYTEDEYKVSIKEVKPQGLLMTVSKGDLTHTCLVNNFQVEDNAPLNLDFKGLAALLSIYQQTTPQLRTLIHCASGVGRTGQMHLIFKALDLLQTDKTFRKAFEDFISVGEISTGQQEYIATVMPELLCEIRKIRYSVQTESQFNSVFAQVALLVAVKMGYKEADIETLRDDFDIDKTETTKIIYAIDPNTKVVELVSQAKPAASNKIASTKIEDESSEHKNINNNN